MKQKINQNGYTLIELLIVLTIVGLLVSVALPQFRNAIRKAKEAVLKGDLVRMREVIDQYSSDKGKYPASLEVLVDEGYIRSIPADPITERDDTWQIIYEDPVKMPDPSRQLGVYDVKSTAVGVALDGTPYNEL